MGCEQAPGGQSSAYITISLEPGIVLLVDCVDDRHTSTECQQGTQHCALCGTGWDSASALDPEGHRLTYSTDGEPGSRQEAVHGNARVGAEGVGREGLSKGGRS